MGDGRVFCLGLGSSSELSHVLALGSSNTLGPEVVVVVFGLVLVLVAHLVDRVVHLVALVVDHLVVHLVVAHYVVHLTVVHPVVHLVVSVPAASFHMPWL